LKSSVFLYFHAPEIRPHSASKNKRRITLSAKNEKGKVQIFEKQFWERGIERVVTSLHQVGEKGRVGLGIIPSPISF
jgi:hypothetical protein